MFVSKAGAKVRSQKDRIIKMQKEGMRILDIAKIYHVTESTMYKYFSRWGIQVMRSSKYEKREFKDKQKFKKRKHWKRKFSKEFLDNRAVITKANGSKIKYINTVNDARDAKLIRNILNKAFI